MSESAEERNEAEEARSTMSPERLRAWREELERAQREVEARLGVLDPAGSNRAKWTDPVGLRPVSEERRREPESRERREP